MRTGLSALRRPMRQRIPGVAKEVNLTLLGITLLGIVCVRNDGTAAANTRKSPGDDSGPVINRTPYLRGRTCISNE